MAFQARDAITAKGARYAVDKCIEEATKNGWNVCIAVVDLGGNLLEFHRMDGVIQGSRDVAIGKAKSAVAFNTASKNMSGAAGTLPGLSAQLGLVMMQGGVPVRRDKQAVGAIGVSGVTAEQDEQIAKAGQTALENPPANL